MSEAVSGVYQRAVSEPKKQRMQNRIDAVAIYRGDEWAAIERVGKVAGLPQKVAIRSRS
jgi:hypothetical protein